MWHPQKAAEHMCAFLTVHCLCAELHPLEAHHVFRPRKIKLGVGRGASLLVNWREERSVWSDHLSVFVHVYETTSPHLVIIGVSESKESLKSPLKLFNPWNPSSMHSMSPHFLLVHNHCHDFYCSAHNTFYTFFSCRMQPFYMALEWFTSITMHFNGEYIYLKHYV